MMPSCCFWGCVHMYTAILENSFFSVLLKLFMCGWGKWRCFLATSKVCTIASCLAWSLLVFSFSWRQWYFLRNTCVREDTVQHKINSLFKYSIGMMNIITEFLCKTQLYYFRYYWIFTFLALVPQFSLICFSSTQIIIFWTVLWDWRGWRGWKQQWWKDSSPEWSGTAVCGRLQRLGNGRQSRSVRKEGMSLGRHCI